MERMVLWVTDFNGGSRLVKLLYHYRRAEELDMLCLVLLAGDGGSAGRQQGELDVGSRVVSALPR